MKRIMTALIILLMTIALVFVGCKKQSQSQQAVPAITGGSGTVVVEVFDRGTDSGKTLAADNAWTDWIKAKVKKDLNIDVTFLSVGRWTENTDIVNLMASQSAPDVCYTYNKGMIDEFRTLGGVLNLAPHIDQYLPDLKKLLGADPVFTGKDFIRRDEQFNTGGAVYGIPSARVALAIRNIFIRKDWLDKLGLAVPNSVDQFYNALVAFRDRDPGNVGRTAVIPYFNGADVRWGMGDLINNSVQKNLTDREIWTNEPIGGDRAISKPGYKEGVRLMNKWYNEKLIYQDFPIAGDTGANIIKSGIVGAFGANWDSPYRVDDATNTDLAKNVPGASFIPVDLNLNNKSMMDKTGLYMFVPGFSKNQKEALQYLNWLARFENYNYLQVGEAGRNHNLVNGVPSVIASTDPKWIQNSSLNIDYTMPVNGTDLGSQDMNMKALALSYPGYNADIIGNAYSISIKDARAPIVHPGTITKTQNSQTLSDKADALLSQAITASPANFDSVWDTGLRDWLASGAQEMIDERTGLWPN